MEGYKVTIVDSSKELSGKEKIMFKDFDNMIQLDQAVTEGDGILLNVTDYVIANVHNERSDNKDYTKYILVADDGQMYITGSEPFWNQFMDIYRDMKDEDEEWSLKIYKRESKNYKGKSFLTCTIV